jgi:hypothetical protein
MGNNDQYRDSFPSWMHPMDNTVERAKHVRTGEVSYMGEKKQEALHFILTHPRKEMQMSARRFAAAWTGLEHPIKKCVRTHSPLVPISLVFNSLAAVGRLAGIILWYRRLSLFAFPLAVFLAVFPCGFYGTQALLRHRHPSDTALMLLTAVALETVVESFAPQGPSALRKSIGPAPYSRLARS